MLQTRESRLVRTFITGALEMFIAGIALLYGYTCNYESKFGKLSCMSFVGAIVVSTGLLIWWLQKHGIRYGVKHTILHVKMYKSLKRALYESGMYTERMILGKKCAVLPEIDIFFEKDFKSGKVTLKNCIKMDKKLEDLPISSALLKEYVLVAAYISDDCNIYNYEFETNKIEQVVFNTFQEFKDYNQKIGEYEMFLDNRHKVNIIHALIVGQTGSGKSYCIYNLILQMLVKETPYELYLVDPKFSGVYALGYKINKCNVSSNIDDTILLLKNFEAKMEERKKEYAEKLLDKLDSDYRDFNLTPVFLIIDEYSAFRASLARYDKKTRDFVDEVIGNVIREGRQIGCFCIIAQQQSNATNLPTELRENLPLKLIMGQAERQTYMTALGIYPDIARRKFLTGQGIMTYPQIASVENPVVVYIPKLNFQIFDAVELLTSRKNGQGGRDGGM